MVLIISGLNGPIVIHKIGLPLVDAKRVPFGAELVLVSLPHWSDLFLIFHRYLRHWRGSSGTDFESVVGDFFSGNHSGSLKLEVGP